MDFPTTLSVVASLLAITASVIPLVITVRNSARPPTPSGPPSYRPAQPPASYPVRPPAPYPAQPSTPYPAQPPASYPSSPLPQTARTRWKAHYPWIVAGAISFPVYWIVTSISTNFIVTSVDPNDTNAAVPAIAYLAGVCLGGLAIFGSVFACWLFTLIQSGILRRWGWFILSLIIGLAGVIAWIVWLAFPSSSTEQQVMTYVAIVFSLGWWITLLLFGLIGPNTSATVNRGPLAVIAEPVGGAWNQLRTEFGWCQAGCHGPCSPKCR
jgi:hypothetical protein